MPDEVPRCPACGHEFTIRVRKHLEQRYCVKCQKRFIPEEVKR